MGFEFSASINKNSKRTIWECINEICVNILKLEVVFIDDDCFQFNYKRKKENIEFSPDIYIEFDENSGLYFLFNLSPDVGILDKIQNELKKYVIDIQIDEM